MQAGFEPHFLLSVAFLKEVGVSGLLDMAIMSLFVYTVLVWFKRTKAAFVVTGILIMSAVYLAARELNLELTASVFHAFFAVILIAVVVIFQEELRHFFEQVAVWSLDTGRTSRKRHYARVSRAEVEILARTVMDLAREKIGALIVLCGRDTIVRHLEGGVDLNGEMSEPLLKSIFDPHSAGHDGAVVIDRQKVLKFGCHLPLSKNMVKLQHTGTRHAAALGLSELSDALCLVVSEERGAVSVSRNGDIAEMSDPEKLTLSLERFYQEVAPRTEMRRLEDFFRENYREKVGAVVISIFLWFFFVHESVIVYRTFSVPVKAQGLERTLDAREIRPERLSVTFSGPRRSFYFVGENRIRLRIKLFDARTGTRRVGISGSDFSFPSGVSLENWYPRVVTVDVGNKEAEQQ